MVEKILHQFFGPIAIGLAGKTFKVQGHREIPTCKLGCPPNFQSIVVVVQRQRFFAAGDRSDVSVKHDMRPVRRNDNNMRFTKSVWFKQFYFFPRTKTVCHITNNAHCHIVTSAQQSASEKEQKPSSSSFVQITTFLVFRAKKCIERCLAEARQKRAQGEQVPPQKVTWKKEKTVDLLSIDTGMPS